MLRAMIHRATLVCIALAVVSCGGGDVEPRQDRETRRADRVRKADDQVAKGPRTVTHQLPNGQLVVMDVPVADSMGFVESQRCFVWRDMEFHTATVSCPQSPEIALQ